jgi:Transglycosylase SLT domain
VTKKINGLTLKNWRLLSGIAAIWEYPVMSYVKSLIIALFISQLVAAGAIAGERVARVGQQAIKDTRVTSAVPLDRVAIAVDGAESSHGNDMAMWRPDPSGPQGPMQVSEAAATDVGGGDRFDLAQNRAIGRAYLAQLYSRYGNWPDAIAAYNWGSGKMDAWLKAGRPPDKFLVGVAIYLRRVLHESGLCEGSVVTQVRQREIERAQEPTGHRPDAMVSTACSASAAWSGPQGGAIGSNRFFKKLDQAMQLAIVQAARSR